MNETLTRAILALDAYNRGYGQKLEINNDESRGQKVGNYTIIEESDIDPNTTGVNADFYAIAYEYNDETVISYRGTDSIWADMWEGFCDGFDQW